MILRAQSIVVVGLALSLGLSACSKRISARYVCRQDAFEFKPDGTLAVTDVKTGALELKGTYKIKGDRITLIPEKGVTLNGVLQGNSIVIEGLPPLVKEHDN